MKVEGNVLQAIIIALLAVLAGFTAWGHLTAKVSSDHDAIVVIVDDIEEIRSAVDDLRLEYAIDKERMLARIRYLESQTNGLNTP